jgi:hypothetical protein
MIQTEIIEIPEDDVVIYNWDSDSGKDLLVKHPYMDLYEYYLEAMIDYYNKEISNYENSMAMFNNTYEEFSSYYKRVKDSGNTLYVKNIW